MTNDFFNDHSFLGGMFDLDRDGSLDPSEAAFMGAMFADEMERSSRKTTRKSNPWDDDYDDDYDDEFDEFGNLKRKKRKERR